MPETNGNGLPVYHVHGTYYPAGSRSGRRFSELIPAQDLHAAVDSVKGRFPGANWTFIGADFTGEYQQELFPEES